MSLRKSETSIYLILLSLLTEDLEERVWLCKKRGMLYLGMRIGNPNIILFVITNPDKNIEKKNGIKLERNQR